MSIHYYWVRYICSENLGYAPDMIFLYRAPCYKYGSDRS